jgi:acyl carrier protein
MIVDAHVAATLREIVLSKAPKTMDGADIDDQAPLDSLGLDSIAIAEVLLECERHFGIVPADLLEWTYGFNSTRSSPPPAAEWRRRSERNRVRQEPRSLPDRPGIPFVSEIQAFSDDTTSHPGAHGPFQVKSQGTE